MPRERRAPGRGRGAVTVLSSDSHPEDGAQDAKPPTGTDGGAPATHGGKDPPLPPAPPTPRLPAPPPADANGAGATPAGATLDSLSAIVLRIDAAVATLGRRVDEVAADVKHLRRHAADPHPGWVRSPRGEPRMDPVRQEVSFYHRRRSSPRPERADRRTDNGMQHRGSMINPLNPYGAVQHPLAGGLGGGTLPPRVGSVYPVRQNTFHLKRRGSRQQPRVSPAAGRRGMSPDAGAGATDDDPLALSGDSHMAVYDINQSHVNLNALRGPAGSVVGDPRCDELHALEQELSTGDARNDDGASEASSEANDGRQISTAVAMGSIHTIDRGGSDKERERHSNTGAMTPVGSLGSSARLKWGRAARGVGVVSAFRRAALPRGVRQRDDPEVEMAARELSTVPGLTPASSPKRIIPVTSSMVDRPRRSTDLTDLDMEEGEAEQEHAIVFLPDCSFRAAWDATYLFFLAYEVIIWTFVMSTWGKGSHDTLTVPVGGVWQGIRVFISIFWLLDMPVQARTARFRGWEIEEDAQTLWKMYSRMRLWVDLIISLPLDVVCSLFLPGRWTYVAMTLRVVRIVRVPPLRGELFMSSTPTREMPRWVEGVLFSFWCVFISHVCCCMWIALAAEKEGENTYDAALAEGISLQTDPFFVYTLSFYFVMTSLTSVGYGDLSPGHAWTRWYNIAVQLLGVSFMMLVSGRTGAYFITTDPFKLLQIDRKRRLESLMVNENIPWNTQKEAFTIYPSLLEAGMRDYQSILLELPDFIQQKVSRHIKVSLIGNVPLFKGVSRRVLTHVAEALIEDIRGSQEYLIQAGDIGLEMYILSQGLVEVLIPSSSRPGTKCSEVWAANLKAGSWFGEIALMKQTTRTASIRSVTSCVLYRLNKQDFDQLLHRSDELRRRLHEETERRMAHQQQQQDGKGSAVISPKKQQGPISAQVGSCDVDKPKEEPVNGSVDQHKGVKKVLMGLMGRVRIGRGGRGHSTSPSRTATSSRASNGGSVTAHAGASAAPPDASISGVTAAPSMTIAGSGVGELPADFRLSNADAATQGSGSDEGGDLPDSMSLKPPPPRDPGSPGTDAPLLPPPAPEGGGLTVATLTAHAPPALARSTTGNASTAVLRAQGSVAVMRDVPPVSPPSAAGPGRTTTGPDDDLNRVSTFIADRKGDGDTDDGAP